MTSEDGGLIKKTERFRFKWRAWCDWQVWEFAADGRGGRAWSQIGRLSSPMNFTVEQLEEEWFRSLPEREAALQRARDNAAAIESVRNKQEILRLLEGVSDWKREEWIRWVAARMVECLAEWTATDKAAKP